MKKLILLLILIGLACFNGFGQAKEITRKEYYKIYNDALNKTSEMPSKRTEEATFYDDNGKVSFTQTTIEEKLANKSQYVEIEKRNNKIVSQNEMIKIDDVIYCRKNNGNWEKTDKWCGFGGGRGLPNIIEQKYTFEKTKENRKTFSLYQNYATYKNDFSKNKDQEGLSFWQNKFWLDKNGFITKIEEISGLIDSNKIYSKRLMKFEYNPKNLKIEAPIK
jgi:hypothetical protein